MRRILFNGNGQRAFIEEVIIRLDSPSLRGLLQFGFDIPYSTLKNYYLGIYLLPEGLFTDMCDLAEIRKDELDFEVVEMNWGQVKGGKKGKRVR